MLTDKQNRIMDVLRVLKTWEESRELLKEPITNELYKAALAINDKIYIIAHLLSSEAFNNYWLENEFVRFDFNYFDGDFYCSYEVPVDIVFAEDTESAVKTFLVELERKELEKKEQKKLQDLKRKEEKELKEFLRLKEKFKNIE